MKTYCKNVDITDPATIQPWVEKCLHGKENRGDFRQLLSVYGDAHGIAVEISRRILARQLNLRPIWFFERRDGLSGKIRTLGVEEPMQICMDYVAVNALMPLFKAKIGYYQCASIPGRGQVFGKKALEKWINGDPAHTRYYEKADIYHCYKSISAEVVERHLRRDVKNETLIWFAMELVYTHGGGLSIGSYLSQYLCNYLLSYVYHHASEQLYKVRRGKRIRLCYHVLMYMDDIYIGGNDKRNLKIAMRLLDKYMQKELGVSLKPNHSVKEVVKEGVDMMGYVVHRSYTTIRGRIFVRARRAFIRGWRSVEAKRFVPLHSAFRIVSYHGFFRNSNTLAVRVQLHVFQVFKAAIQTISYYAKKRGIAHAQLQCPVH